MVKPLQSAAVDHQLLLPLDRVQIAHVRELSPGNGSHEDEMNAKLEQGECTARTRKRVPSKWETNDITLINRVWQDYKIRKSVKTTKPARPQARNLQIESNEGSGRAGQAQAQAQETPAASCPSNALCLYQRGC